MEAFKTWVDRLSSAGVESRLRGRWTFRIDRDTFDIVAPDGERISGVLEGGRLITSTSRA